MKRLLLVLLLLFATCVCLAQKPPKSSPTYIRAGRLFDATTDNVRENVIIVVEGGRIQSVTPTAQVQIPVGANVIDLSRARVLPGLIGCHSHIGSGVDRYDEIHRFKDTPFSSAFAATVHARKTLEAGFTSVRDVGSKPFLAVDLRNAINEGLIPGPRIVASGPGISITGGPGDFEHYSPPTTVRLFSRVAA